MLKSFFFRSFDLFIYFFGPTCFKNSWNFVKVKTEILIHFSCKIKGWIYFLIHNCMNFINNKFSLFLNSIRNLSIVNSFMNFALHHGGSTIVLNISLPSSFRHLQMFGKTLFSEVFYSIVICVSDEILNSNVLCVGLQSVHQSSSIAFNLFRSTDSQKHNFCKLLWMKWSKNASSKNSWFIRAHSSFICFINFPFYHHCFMLSIHRQSDNVISWHSWKLLGNNVFEINQVSHRC